MERYVTLEVFRCHSSEMDILIKTLANKTWCKKRTYFIWFGWKNCLRERSWVGLGLQVEFVHILWGNAVQEAKLWARHFPWTSSFFVVFFFCFSLLSHTHTDMDVLRDSEFWIKLKHFIPGSMTLPCPSPEASYEERSIATVPCVPDLFSTQGQQHSSQLHKCFDFLSQGHTHRTKMHLNSHTRESTHWQNMHSQAHMNTLKYTHHDTEWGMTTANTHITLYTDFIC